jgi:Flp pilus assembly protein TadG
MIGTLSRRWCSAALRLHRRVQGREHDLGAFAVLELVILVPFVIVMMLLVVGFGRVERGRQLVDQAAQAASRAASLSINPNAAQTAAQQAVKQTLSDGGLSCAAMTVTIDTSAFYAGGQVTAHLSCRADLSQLALAGLPGSARLTADSTSPLELYRQLDGSGNQG